MGKKKSPEKLVIAAASAGAAVGAAYLALGNVIFNMTMSKKSIAKKIEAKQGTYNEITQRGMEWFEASNPAKVKIVTPRGGYVHGEIILADEPSDVWVIVVHGYTGSPKSMGRVRQEVPRDGLQLPVPAPLRPRRQRIEPCRHGLG